MDPAFDPGQWHEFAVAVAGASAALAGLLVVAVSINLREIVAAPELVRRAAGALITLTAPLVLALLVLIPDVSDGVLGVSLIAIALFAGVSLFTLNSPGQLSPQHTRLQWLVGTALFIGILTVTTLLAGIGVMASALGGLNWLPVAVIAAFVGGLTQAWVLLVEILR